MRRRDGYELFGRHAEPALGAELGAEVDGSAHDAASPLIDARRDAPDTTSSVRAATAAALLAIHGGGDVGTAYRLPTGDIGAKPAHTGPPRSWP